MTNDQVERAINFILDQQARTDAVMQGMGYKNSETEANLRQTEAILHQVADRHSETEAILQRMAGKHAETEATLDRVGVKLEQISNDLAILTADAVTTDYELNNHSDDLYSLKQLTEAQSQAINRLIDLSDRSNTRHERTEEMMAQLTERLDQLRELMEKQFRAGRNGDSAH